MIGEGWERCYDKVIDIFFEGFGIVIRYLFWKSKDVNLLDIVYDGRVFVSFVYWVVLFE